MENNEDFDKSLVEKDDMVVLEIISEKLIKELIEHSICVEF